MDTQEVVLKYYECVNTSDWKTWLTLFTDDIVGDEQLAGHFSGINALKGAVDAISKGYSKFLMHPEHIVINDGSCCVVWRCEAANAKGVRIAYPNDPNRPVIGANYFEVNNGKITYMRTMHDSVPFAPFINQ